MAAVTILATLENLPVLRDIYQVAVMQEKLTRREKEILDLLLGGSSSKDISKALGISNDTVLSHQKSLYRKLGIHKILPNNSPTKGMLLVSLIFIK